MDLNSVTVVGQLSAAPTLKYRADGVPVLALVVTIREVNAKLGRTFTLRVPCETMGTKAEALAEQLEVGSTVVVQGKLAMRGAGAGSSARQLVVYASEVALLAGEAAEPGERRA